MKILNIFLSALFFVASYLFLIQAGFLIIPAFIILFKSFKFFDDYKSCFYAGLIWGFSIYSLHVIWFLELLLNKSHAGLLNALLIYLFIILYLALLTAITFSVIYFLFLKTKNLFIKILIFILSFYLYFYFITNKLLFFIDKNFGYPFINPLIPLARYKIFLFLINIFNLNFYGNRVSPDINLFLQKNKIIYVKPIIKSFNNNYNANTMALMIYQQLAELDLYKISKNYERLIIVTPESFFPYSLNEHPQILSLWQNALPENSILFLTGQRSEEDNIKKYYQTIYRIESGRIIDFYDKKHKFWFVEKVPKKFKKNEWSEKLFLTEKCSFSKGRVNNKVFNINNQIKFIPVVCSEFFFDNDKDPPSLTYSKGLMKMQKLRRAGWSPGPRLRIKLPTSLFELRRTRRRARQDRDDNSANILLLVINDSWFANYFKKILYYYSVLRANKKNMPILYVGHTDYSIIKPYKLRFV